MQVAYYNSPLFGRKSANQSPLATGGESAGLRLGTWKLLVGSARCANHKVYHGVYGCIGQSGRGAERVSLDNAVKDLTALLSAQFIHACNMLARARIVKVEKRNFCGLFKFGMLCS
jgi:hypothetical protein